MKLGEFVVKFEHMCFDKETAKGVVKVPFATKATIFNSEGTRLSMGTAQCGAKDLYEKRIGRKISLKRALDSLSLQKEVRTNIWKEYHDRVRFAPRP